MGQLGLYLLELRKIREDLIETYKILKGVKARCRNNVPHVGRIQTQGSQFKNNRLGPLGLRRRKTFSRRKSVEFSATEGSGGQFTGCFQERVGCGS